MIDESAGDEDDAGMLRPKGSVADGSVDPTGDTAVLVEGAFTLALEEIVAASGLTHAQIAERMRVSNPPCCVTRERVTQIVHHGCGANRTLRAFAQALGQPLSVVMEAEEETFRRGHGS